MPFGQRTYLFQRPGVKEVTDRRAPMLRPGHGVVCLTAEPPETARTGRPMLSWRLDREVLRRNYRFILLAILAAVLLVYRPGTVPPLFFDEGWNLMVARNWLELGHYGPLMNGRPMPGWMLSTGFPAVLPLALSFRLFGIGLWQSRLPGIFFTAGAIAFICYLAYRIFGRGAATGTLAVLLLMPIHPELHPILIGRQALGEMPAIFYVLAGYVAFLKPRKEGPLQAIPAGIFWGLALVSKPQVIPFLLVSLVLPLLWLGWRRQHKILACLGTATATAVICLAVFTFCQKILLRDPQPPQTHVGHWLGSTTIVPYLNVRLAVLDWTLTFALPTIFALVFAATRFFRGRTEPELPDRVAVAKLSLLLLSGSWLSWYFFLSIGFMRYLYPAMFFGSIFTCEMLRHLTNDLRPPELGANPRSALALLALILIAWSVPLTTYALITSCCSSTGQDVERTAEYLNRHTPPGCLIGTGEIELLFLLNRPYVFGVELFPVSLPLDFRPAYMVVGRMIRATEGVKAIPDLERRYKPCATFGQYTIYSLGI
jgi:4-amino-4-deoxy-L-arabinose transferase-like glycosyltransferase